MSSPAVAMRTERLVEPRSRRDSFFFVAQAVLLLIVLIGFSRTLYLRAFFDVQPMRAFLFVHGAILTAWFVIALIQTRLIRTGQVQTHRRLGTITVIFASLIILTGLIATHHMAAGIESPASAENIIVWGNYITLLTFAGLLTAAVLLRRRAAAHKRLMLLASISIVPPALGRFPLWPIFAAGLDAAKNYAIGGLLILLISAITYDIVVRRKPHPATWIGALAIFLGMGVAVGLGVTGVGYQIIQSFK